MTEQEWLECTDPPLMLEFLRVKASPRSFALFACAVARISLSTIERDKSSIIDPLSPEYYDNTQEFRTTHRKSYSRLVHDIFGNPFHPCSGPRFLE